MYLNEQAEFFYKIFLGDKETFHLAWRRLRHPFTLGLKAEYDQLPEGKIFFHHDMKNRVIFQHRSGPKFTLEDNYRHPSFINEDKCIEYIEELNAIVSIWERP